MSKNENGHRHHGRRLERLSPGGYGVERGVQDTRQGLDRFSNYNMRRIYILGTMDTGQNMIVEAKVRPLQRPGVRVATFTVAGF